MLINYKLQPNIDILKQQSVNNTIQVLQDYINMLSQVRNNPTKALFDQAVERGYVPVVKLSLEKGIQISTDDLKRVKDLYTQTANIVNERLATPSVKLKQKVQQVVAGQLSREEFLINYY